MASVGGEFAVSDHGRLGLVQEPPQLPVVAPAPWATWGAVTGARAALHLAVADLPWLLGRADGGACVGEAAARPSLRHGGDGWVGAPLEPAALHCTLGVKEVSLMARAQLSALTPRPPCPAACLSWPQGVEFSATSLDRRGQVLQGLLAGWGEQGSILARAPSRLGTGIGSCKGSGWGLGARAPSGESWGGVALWAVPGGMEGFEIWTG